MIKYPYVIFCGGFATMTRISEHGARGLNKKTNKWQIIDKNAKYIIKKRKGVLYDLFSNLNLPTIARQKGLII